MQTGNTTEGPQDARGDAATWGQDKQLLYFPQTMLAFVSRNAEINKNIIDKYVVWQQINIMRRLSGCRSIYHVCVCVFILWWGCSVGRYQLKQRNRRTRPPFIVQTFNIRWRGLSRNKLFFALIKIWDKKTTTLVQYVIK